MRVGLAIYKLGVDADTVLISDLPGSDALCAGSGLEGEDTSRSATGRIARGRPAAWLCAPAKWISPRGWPRLEWPPGGGLREWSRARRSGGGTVTRRPCRARSLVILRPTA